MFISCSDSPSQGPVLCCALSHLQRLLKALPSTQVLEGIPWQLSEYTMCFEDFCGYQNKLIVKIIMFELRPHASFPFATSPIIIFMPTQYVSDIPYCYYYKRVLF